MKTSNLGGRFQSIWAWLGSAAVMLMALSFPAFAALGGDASSIEADSAHMKASVKVTQTDGYAVHEIQAPTKTVVKEYVSGGRVFAVTWRGPFIPDLQQLLGAYFQQYSAAVQNAKSKYVGHRPLNIQQPGLVVQTSGHMRAYFGRVYIPEMTPAGVKAEDIQ